MVVGRIEGRTEDVSGTRWPPNSRSSGATGKRSGGIGLAAGNIAVSPHDRAGTESWQQWRDRRNVGLGHRARHEAARKRLSRCNPDRTK